MMKHLVVSNVCRKLHLPWNDLFYLCINDILVVSLYMVHIYPLTLYVIADLRVASSQTRPLF